MSSTGHLKRFDAYAKTLDDFRIRTLTGGCVTILSSFVILFVLLYELKTFFTIDVVQVLFVDTSRQEKMNISLDIHFARLPCSYLTVDAMDVAGESQTDIVHHLYKTRLDLHGKPIENETKKISLQPTSTTTSSSSSSNACESCYGAESTVIPCCSTCDDVKSAYRTKGWSFDPAGIHQCVREGKTVGLPNSSGETVDEGCRIHGYLEVNKVSGNFHIAPGQSFEQHHVHVHSLRNLRLSSLNTSHRIEHLAFGDRFPQQINPLSNTEEISKDASILYHYYIKVVPTTYVFLNGESLLTNQYSVTKHRKMIRNIFDSNDHQLPGLFVTYEISAIMVKFIEEKRSLAHFLTSICAMIGGIFTFSSLIDSFVYRGTRLFEEKFQLGPKPEHCYARSWLEDPTLSTALPHVQLFTDPSQFNDEQHPKITWPPTIFTQIPDRFQCEEKSIEFDTDDDEIFIENIRKILDQVHLAVLTCDLNGADVVYWRLAIHRILMKLVLLLDDDSQFLNRLDWLHETICRTSDRQSVEHYIDLFRILYDEYPKIRSMFVEKEKLWPNDSIEMFVYEKLLEKPNDFTEEVIYSLPLMNFPSPTICLIIPGLDLPNHRQRIAFWQKNLSQITTVFLSSFIDFEHRHDSSHVQSSYDDVLKKFNEIRQWYPNHKILFLGWNVGCVIALKAALVCPIATIVCLGLPWLALSDESKNDFTQINASILFVHGEHFWNDKLENYRRRLKGKNGLIEIGFTDEQLRMSEQGKYQFRLTQSMLEKYLMEEIIDFIAILSPKPTRPIETTDELDVDLRKKRLEENSDEIFLFTGDLPSTIQTQTLSIAPEHDPQSIFVQTSVSTGSTRKRKAPNPDANGPKRGRQQKPKPVDQPPKKPATTKKKSKVNSTPTATTSILNTLLQLPSHQPKTRPIDSSSSSFVNTFLSSHLSFGSQQ